MLKNSLFAIRHCYGYVGRRFLSKNENLVSVKHENGVRNIVMISPKTRNALSLAMMDALLHGIEGNRDPGLRCIVISSTGPVFSSGHNLKDLANVSRDFYLETFNKCRDLMLAIQEAPVPVIACVDGIAAAAGCQLVASCDIAISTDSSKFSTPGASFGIFCSTPGIALARTVGRKAALQMLLTGDMVSAQEALRIGLLTAVCQQDDLAKEVERHVVAIKSKSRAVIELGKRFLYQQIEMDIRSAYRLGSEVMTNNLLLPDGQEGLSSFVEKRAPTWTHSAPGGEPAVPAVPEARQPSVNL